MCEKSVPRKMVSGKIDRKADSIVVGNNSDVLEVEFPFP